MSTIEAVILGGGGVEEWFEYEHVTNKGMLDVGGKPLIGYTVEALEGISEISRVTLIGDGYSETVVKKVESNLPDAGSLPANIDQAFNHAKADYILVLTSDVPFITKDTINGILESMDWKSYDLSMPVISKIDMNAKFPGTKRTYAKLKEGHVKVGNLFILKREAYPKIEPIVKETAKRRKSVIKQALQLGFGFLVSLLLIKNVSIPELEKRVSKILGISVHAPILAYPEIGIDVDKPSDLEYCRGIMETH